MKSEKSIRNKYYGLINYYRVEAEFFIKMLLRLFGMSQITIGKRVYYLPGGYYIKRMIRHEEIHVLQQFETGLLMFMIMYFFWYVKGLFIFRSHAKAYRAIPYEAEAYANSRNQFYIGDRKPFAHFTFNNLRQNTKE